MRSMLKLYKEAGWTSQKSQSVRVRVRGCCQTVASAPIVGSRYVATPCEDSSEATSREAVDNWEQQCAH
jgi:hypothetical protein